MANVVSIESQIKSFEEKIRERRAANERDQQSIFALYRQQHKENLTELVGKANAVRLRHRYQTGDQCAKLNDLSGTLTEIRKTRCSVMFKNGELWNLLLDEVAPMTQEQGFQIGFGVQ